MATSSTLTQCLALALIGATCLLDTGCKGGAGEPDAAEAGEAEAEAEAAQAGEAGEEEATGTGDAALAAASTGETGDAGDADTDGDASATTLDVTVGVEVCDGYASAWKACIAEKAPEAERATLEKELGEQLAAWKQTVEGGGSAAAVEIGCTTARETAKVQGQAWGCEL